MGKKSKKKPVGIGSNNSDGIASETIPAGSVKEPRKRTRQKIIDLANAVAEKHDADVFLFNGEMTSGSDHLVIQGCIKRKRRDNIFLMIITNGGDPHVAYRISRCFQQKYNKFIAYVSGRCKSAGTIAVIGANEIIMSDYGELGPLDVQLNKSDELWKTRSGLVPAITLETLKEESYSMFEKYLIELQVKSDGRITLKTAAEIAGNITTGLFGRLYEQVNPDYLGEVARAMNISMEYGKRLDSASKNLQESALEILSAEYQSHSFVIDRHESSKLFHRVLGPEAEELALSEILGDLALYEQNERRIANFISAEEVAEDTGQPREEIDGDQRKEGSREDQEREQSEASISS